MPRFIDLDQIAPPDVRVQIAGTVYRLPGDVSVPDYFELDRLSTTILNGGEDAADALQELDVRLLKLFQVHQPDLTGLPVGPRLLISLVMQYLNEGGDEVTEEEADRPRERASTTTKPAGKPRSKTATRRPRAKTASGSST